MERSFMQFALKKFNPETDITVSDLSVGELNLRIQFETKHFDPGESRRQRASRLTLIEELESLKLKKWKKIINGSC